MSAKIIVMARADGGAEIEEAITALGFDPLVEPVLSIQYVEDDPPEIEDTTPLIFTSANGVRALARKTDSRTNKVYAVGRNTADEARQAGFENIENAQGTVDDLAELLLEPLRTSLIPALYVRGEEISHDLAAILTKNGVSIQQWIGYKAIPAQNLSIRLLKKLDSREIEAIMFFSARGGQNFAELAEQYDRVSRMRTIRALCISEAVLKSVSVLPFRDAVISDTPDRYGMMKLLQDLHK